MGLKKGSSTRTVAKKCFLELFGGDKLAVNINITILAILLSFVDFSCNDFPSSLWVVFGKTPGF
jgi:hypothetical protein